MAEKPAEEGYISVVDDDPEIFELLKWDAPQPSIQKHFNIRSTEKPKSVEKKSPKPKEDSDPFDLSDQAFLESYRITKDMARSLCEELTPCMPDSAKSLEFSVQSKVLAALSFYASGKYQKSVGGKSDPNITQYFVTNAVVQVTQAMNHPTFMKKYIHFPHLKNERDIIKTRFYLKYGMPNVLGCVDCTHVPITRPDDNQKKHFNKSYHSKKVQISLLYLKMPRVGAKHVSFTRWKSDNVCLVLCIVVDGWRIDGRLSICDSDMNILSVEARHGGASTHYDILNEHAVRIDLESLNHSGEQCWLIASSQYRQRPYVMIPVPRITKKSPMSPEKYYTNIHSQTHSAVTDTIKYLKARWKCLQVTCNRLFGPQTVSMLITACCILHNICNRQGLPFVQMTPAEERLEIMKQKVANNVVSKKSSDDPSGVQVRAMLVERLWSERRVAPESCGNGAKKRQARKEKVVESQPPPPMIHQPMQHPMHHEDPSKRPRIVMNNPTYSIGMAPGWGHYPQH